jgi:nucleoid-associated protein YgaU
LFVILAVLAGPSVVSCFNAEGGMGVCLRGKMTDAGILPRQAVASGSETPAEEAAVALAAPDTETPAAPAAQSAPSAAEEPQAEPAPQPQQQAEPLSEPETAVGTAALDVEPASEPANDAAVDATFGMRVEPDGSVVIAGSGTPGTELEVYSDEELLGTAEVEPSGDWVLVPDAPIAPGGTEISVAEAGKEGRAPQSFVVVVDEDKTSEPLVVASTPGAASEILQGLDRPATRIAPEAAVAAPATPSPTIPPATAPAVEEPVAPQQSPTQAPSAQTEPVAPPAPADATPPAVSTAPAIEPQAEPEAPPSPPVATAAADPTSAAPAASPAVTPPTIDAIELEGDRTFFAGAGSEGDTVRLYVDDTFVADAEVEDGRWLVEAGKVLTKPNQRVRVDALAGEGGDVTARAEVNFELDLPQPAAPIAVAEAEPATEAPSTTAATSPAAAAPSTTAPSAPTAPATEPSTATTAPAAEPAVADSPAATEPTPTAEQTASAPVEESDSVPTMVAVSVGGPDSERFASGKAIIRRGDNLWTIARRVYGEGIRYTTIYEANNGQIRDPDRIYPGQVFDLPN